MKDIFYDLTIEVDGETLQGVYKLFQDNEKDCPSLSMINNITTTRMLKDPVELTIAGYTTQEDLIRFLEKSIRR